MQLLLSHDARVVVMHSLQIGLIFSLNMALLMLTTPREVATSKKITIVFGGIFLCMIVGVCTADHFHITKEIAWVFITTAASMAWLVFRGLLAMALMGICAYSIAHQAKLPKLSIAERFFTVACILMLAFYGVPWLAAPLIESITRSVVAG